MTRSTWFSNTSSASPVVLVLCLFEISLIGYIDLVTSQKISLYVFYAIPIFIGSWFGNPFVGLLVCLSSVIAWMIVDVQLRSDELSIDLWNAGLRFCFFFGISYVLSSLKSTLEREKRLSHVDFLTDLPNRRAFLDVANQERERAIRYKHPLTLAYIDLDNFKQINDVSGHDVGDSVLKEIALVLKNNIRKSDMVARVGGDEFVLLLPETEFNSSEMVLQKLNEELRKRMREKDANISVSIGAVTYTNRFPKVRSMIENADHIMYSAKASGKNRILHTSVQD